MDLTSHTMLRVLGSLPRFRFWFTRKPPDSVAQVRIDSAVKPQWIDPKTGALQGSSPIDNVYAVLIPTGTRIYEGPVGYQAAFILAAENQVRYSCRNLAILQE